jgi:hypothetical protein
VARTQAPDTLLSLVARELKINANQLFNSRKRIAAEAFAKGSAPGPLVAVTVFDMPPDAAPVTSAGSGVIVLSGGRPSRDWKARLTRSRCHCCWRGYCHDRAPRRQ